MKTLTLALGMTIVGSSLAVACGGAQKVPLQTTGETPAAEGKVAVEHTDQGNTRLTLEVEHLAPPNRVVPGAQTYVVWAKSLAPHAQPENLGSLQVDSDRKGKLETTTPLDKFDVFVTPEAAPNAPAPTNAPVMRAQVAR
jgi:hypothetical protein